MALKRKRSDESAIVIGGSMAGLLAARVLSEAYAEVTVIERDTLPATADQRSGVPQGHHAHALLARGREILELLFPGLTQCLADRGAPRGSGRFYAGGGYLCRIEDGLEALFASRPLLEAEVRSRLRSLPGVHILEDCRALGLEATPDRSRVAGVRLVRGRRRGVEEVLSAALVVDATGRGSRTPAWLEGLGYARPEVERVDVKMGYASRLYRRRAEHLGGDLIANVAPTRDDKRACGMLAQEGDRWMVTLAGYFGDYPPTDEGGFLEFARSLPVPDVYDVIRTATPLSDPVPFRFPANQRHYYEKLSRFPEGFLVLGDAICSFTPIYGQGMTVAALEALALRECLEAGVDRLAQRFFRRAGKIVDTAWGIAAGNDVSLSEAAVALPPPQRFINWYIRKLQAAARRDPAVALAFMKVANMMAPLPSILRPSILLRVLWHNVRPAKPSEHENSSTSPVLVQG